MYNSAILKKKYFLYCLYIQHIVIYSIQYFKGTVQRDFRPTDFFYHSIRPGPRTNELKHFRMWFRFRRDIRILVPKKLTLRSIILRGVKKMFYPRTLVQK